MAPSRLLDASAMLSLAWTVICSVVPLHMLRRSLLLTVRKSSSSCTGVYTSEMGLAMMQKTCNDSGVLGSPVNIIPTTTYDACFRLWAQQMILFFVCSGLSAGSINYWHINLTNLKRYRPPTGACTF